MENQPAGQPAGRPAGRRVGLARAVVLCALLQRGGGDTVALPLARRLAPTWNSFMELAHSAIDQNFAYRNE